MNPNDRTPIPDPDDRLQAIFWTLRKGVRVAECVRWSHPYGFEVRCAVDGEVVQTAVFRLRENAVDQAADWQQAFETKGWAK